MPRAARPLSSLALRLEGAVYLLDCGEGTQVPYAVHHVGVRNLRVVALSHLHADGTDHRSESTILPSNSP